LKQRCIIPVVFIEQVLQRLMLILAGKFVAGLKPMALVGAIRAALGLPNFVGALTYLLVLVYSHDLLRALE
jgi:hypothetical protein